MMLGRLVYYRSKTGDYTCPAVISATVESLFQPNVEAGHLRALSSPTHVHLTVFTAGLQGHVSERTAESHPELADPGRPNAPFGGTYQEFDIPQWMSGPETDRQGRWLGGDLGVQPPGTWAWPPHG